MDWTYFCRKCKQQITVAWSDRGNYQLCPNRSCADVASPPAPADQHDAFVDTHNWPQEMEDVVVAEKGDRCTAPGCNATYETLDHRIPHSQNGPTSVDNLWPMCNHHNQSKGDTDYDTWVANLQHDP